MKKLAAAILVVGVLVDPAAGQDAKPAIPAPRTGDFKDEYKDPVTQELVMRYRMATPKVLPEEKILGLLVCFHGMNGNEDSMVPEAVESAKRLKIEDQYVIMGGKARGAGWTAGDDLYLLKWIDWAKKTYPIDVRRVSIVGGSNGGWMAKRFSWQYKDLFSGCVAYFGGGHTFEDESRDPKLPPKPPPPPGPPSDTRLEYYIVHGDKDALVDVKTSRDCTADLKRRGYRYVYREIAGGDHGNVWSIEGVRDDGIAFLHALRSKEIPLRADDRKYLSGVKSNPDLLNEPGTISELARIGGVHAGLVLANAFDRKEEDLRQLAAEATQKTLFGPVMVRELIKLLGDKSEAVREAALKGLATAANWRYEEAQQILCQRAARKSAKVEERRGVTEALARAARLQLLAATPEDKGMIWALVHLLEDDDADVREIALGCLKTAVKDGWGFRPQDPPSEQKDALAKAKSWAVKVLGPTGGGRSPRGP